MVVKSISFAGLNWPSLALSHVHPPVEPHHVSREAHSMGGRAVVLANAPAGRTPHWHVEPVGFIFSVAALSHVHSPAGLARQEQRGPSIAFSLAALSQVQWSADCLPHEQVACWAGRRILVSTSLTAFWHRITRRRVKLTARALVLALAAAGGGLENGHGEGGERWWKSSECVLLVWSFAGLLGCLEKR